MQQYESSKNSLLKLKYLCVANARYDNNHLYLNGLTLTNYIGLSISLSSHLLDRKFVLHQSPPWILAFIRRLLHHFKFLAMTNRPRLLNALAALLVQVFKLFPSIISCLRNSVHKPSRHRTRCAPKKYGQCSAVGNLRYGSKPS